MTKISKSPDRMTFQSKTYEEKLVENPTNRNARAMVEMWKQWREEAEAQEIDSEWQKNNLEYDLRTDEVILNKVRASETYAQNLYAALCNMQYLKLDVIPVLRRVLELFLAAFGRNCCRYATRRGLYQLVL